MNKYCDCDNNLTRNFTEAHNNLCPQCGKKLVAKINFRENPPKFRSPEKRKASENSHYQNKNSPVLGVDNLSFTENSFVCHCTNQPLPGQFCAECGGKDPLYSNIKQENNFYANTSNQEVPQSSLNQPSHYIDPLTHHLYDNPNLLRQTIIRLDSDADEDSDNNPLSPGASDNEIEEEPPEPNNNPVEQEQIAPPIEQPQEPNNNPVEPEQYAPLSTKI